jgi:hypothetical protein
MNSFIGDVTPEEVHAVGQRAAAGELQGVELPVGLQQRGHREALVDPQPALHPVVHVQLAEDGDAVAGHVAHGLDHPPGQAHPVLDGAAVLVGAVVQVGAEERAQQVVVTQVDLHRIEPGGHRHLGGPPEVGHHVVDLGGRGRLHPAHGGCAHAGGRRQGWAPVGPGVGHQAGVADLGRHQAALVVHGVGEPLQVGGDLRTHHQRVAVDPAPLGHRAVRHRGERGSTGGHPTVEGDQVVAHRAVGHHALERGCLHDPVAEGQGAQPVGVEQVGNSALGHENTF